MILRHRLAILCLAAAALAGAAGCTDTGGLKLELSDQLAQPGQTVDVQATIVRKGLSQFFPPTSPPPLRVYRDNDLLKQFQPGGSNWAFTTRVRLDTVGEHAVDAIYQRRRDTKPDQATSYAYCWDSSRVAIVVDFDRVVNRTTRMDRFIGDRPLGEPLPDAADTLTSLARRFYLCYVTSLPPAQKESIRQWMRANRIPAGPIFTWDRASNYSVTGGNQASVLDQLRQRVPTLLIGIGDGDDDLAAFTRNKMLAVMIASAAPLKGDLDVPQFATWHDAYELFIEPANQAILADPAHMLDLHLRGGHYIDTVKTGTPK